MNTAEKPTESELQMERTKKKQYYIGKEDLDWSKVTSVQNKIKIQTFDEEVGQLCKEFSELVKPSSEAAKFSEKLFTVIGKMQGQLKFLKEKEIQN